MRMALDRRILKRSNLEFFKLLGTGSGKTFTTKDADPLRWGLLMVGDDLPDLKHWDRHCLAKKEFVLAPIAVHGKWSRREPFKNVPTMNSNKAVSDWSGKVVAITRARIKWRHNLTFWRAVPPVNHALHASPGLIKAIGIGEAPIGLQGTFSLWDSPQAIRDFAYRSPAHQEAIKATERIGWYAEEMFARFALLEESGDW